MDDKILCGMNGLLAVAMIQAGRFLARPDLELEAASLIQNLLNRFWDGKALKHSYFHGQFLEQSYLFDGAAVLTAISMLYENDDTWSDMMTQMTVYVETFREGNKWIESRASDFRTVYASWTDHPVPSSVSLAEMGLTRAAFLTGKEYSPINYREPFISDFYNITAMMNNGLFHLFESQKILPWKNLPVNSIRIKGNNDTDCYMGTCRPLGNDYIQSEL